MVAHPGTTDADARALAAAVRRLEREGEKPVEGVQIFTPTPMTRSTAMYHTGKDPVTGEEVFVPRSYAEKKEQKRLLTAGPGDPPGYSSRRVDGKPGSGLTPDRPRPSGQGSRGLTSRARRTDIGKGRKKP